MAGKIVKDFFSEYRQYFLFATLFIALGNISYSYAPLIIGNLMDHLQTGTITPLELLRYAGMIIGIGFISGAIMSCGTMMYAIRGRDLEFRMRELLFRKYQSIPMAQYQKYSTGDLLSLIMSDIVIVRDVYSISVWQFLRAVFFFLAALVMLIWHADWKLSLASLFPLLFIQIIRRVVGRKIEQKAAESQNALSELSQSVNEYSVGMRTIKLLGMETYFLNTYEEKCKQLLDKRIKLSRASSLMEGLLPMLGGLSYLISFCYGGLLLIQQHITVGNFFSYTMYIAMAIGPINQLALIFGMYDRSKASLKRISRVMNTDDLSVYPIGAPENAQELFVKQLSYQYPGSERTILKDISFKLKKGESLGIIGSTGSGKTTMVQLLLRLFEPPAGTIFINGKDVTELSLLEVRDQISCVPQDGFLFSTTLMDNIAFADTVENESKAYRSAQIADMYETIDSLPERFQTQLGERGFRFSGGQKQRIAIARSLYKESPILIFDDSLSALDTKTEANIWRNIDKHGALKDRMSIIISNKVSTVAHADTIILLEDGVIVEAGSHSELLSMNGNYARLYASQRDILEMSS